MQSGAVDQFKMAMAAEGYILPGDPVSDGTLHRFSHEDGNGGTAGWYVLHADGIPAGSFGDWRSGRTFTWCAKGESEFTPAEREDHQRRIEQQKATRRQAETQARDKAANRARQAWDAAQPANPDHPYLSKKGVNAYGIRQDKDGRLLVPVRDPDGNLTSIQTIDSDGGKLFLPGGRKRGCCHSIKGNDSAVFYLCEGYATGATIHEATGANVVIAFDAGNLLPVAEAIREKYPFARIVIAADDDRTTNEKIGRNPGREAAETTARAVNGLVAIPAFKVGGVGSDFNDLYQTEGTQAVVNCLDAATRPGPAHDSFDDWPDPIPLPDGLPTVAPFDDALLPEILQPWASDITERMQCPPDYVAVAIVAAAGAVIGRKITVRPQASTDWTVTPNQWALLIGRPGFLKSPAMEAALAPVKRLVALAVENYQEQIKEYTTAKAVDKLRMEAAEKAARVELKNNPRADVSALLAIDLAEEPTMRRYIANDTSAAALGELHRQNPNGLLIFRDELVSLVKMLDQEENSEARGFYLTGWNGDSPYTFDRITRGMNLSIPAVCLSMLGSTQPARIAQYVKGAVSGTGDDGLLQRFGLLVWPDATASWKEIDRWPDSEAKRAAFDVFDRLDRITPSTIGAQQDTGLDGGPDGSPYLRFAPEGLGLFREWRQDLEIRLRAGDLHPALESHFAKYRKLVPGLALIFHLTSGSTGPIRGRAVLQALAWSEYLATHARRLYASITAPEVSTAKAILKKIRKGDLSTVLTVRQVWRPQWSGLTDLNAIKEGVTLLVDFGWMRKIRIDTGGRPAEVYETHPRVVEVTG